MSEIVVHSVRERMTRKEFEEARVLVFPDHVYNNFSGRAQRVLYQPKGESKKRWYSAYRTASFGRSYVVLSPIIVVLEATDL